MKIKVLALALTFGVVSGLAIFAMTLIAMYASYGTAITALVESVYPYYELSWTGALIGTVEGFVDGFIGGAIIAALYNFFSGK